MEKWKDDILNSLEGIERAKPNSNLFEKIQAKTRKSPQEKNYGWLAVAATISLVICFNVYLILNYNNQDTNPETHSYGNLISNYNIYE